MESYFLNQSGFFFLTGSILLLKITLLEQYFIIYHGMGTYLFQLLTICFMVFLKISHKIKLDLTDGAVNFFCSQKTKTLEWNAMEYIGIQLEPEVNVGSTHHSIQTKSFLK